MSEQQTALAKATAAISFQPASITADWDGMQAAFDRMMEPYRGMDDKALEALDESELRRCRADVNALVKGVEDARRKVKRAYNEPLKAFEDRCKELVEPARQASAQLKAAIDGKEEARKAGRLAALDAAYKGFLEDNGRAAVYDACPVESFEEKGWLNKSTPAKKAEEGLLSRVAAFLRDLDAFDQMAPNMRFADEARAELMRTHDLAGAVALDKRRAEEQGRVDAVERERKANEEWVKEQTRPAQEQQADERPDDDSPREWVVRVTGTRAQMQAVASCLAAMGLHGTFTTAKEGR